MTREKTPDYGRQGKSLAVPPAYMVGIIEVFAEPPERACQPFPLKSL